MPKQPEEPDQPANARPVSLRPLPYKEAVANLLKVKPPEKDAKTKPVAKPKRKVRAGRSVQVPPEMKRT